MLIIKWMRFVQIQIPVKYEPICKSGPTTRPEACSVMLCSSCHSEKGATDQLILRYKCYPVPAKCLSDVPLAPNLVTSFPFDWKMKTQQALLSAVMICPFLSTATPLGPINLPAPILFCDSQMDSLADQFGQSVEHLTRFK